MQPPRMPFPPGTRRLLPATPPRPIGPGPMPPTGAFTAPSMAPPKGAPTMAAKPNPFEKRDKAADKKAGIKENSKKDQAMDKKAMGRKKTKK